MRLPLAAALLILTTGIAAAQSVPGEPICGMPDVPAPPPSGSPAASATVSAEALKWIPTMGQINALVVFVQHRTDTHRACNDTQLLAQGLSSGVPYDPYCLAGDAGNRYQSQTEDPATEWPAFRMFR